MSSCLLILVSLGSTLKARVDPSSVMGHSNTANSFIVSRPEHVSQPHVPTHVVQVTVARPEPNPAPSNGQLSSAAPAAPTGGRDNFADFANFDAAAFDSEPAGEQKEFLINNHTHG